MTDAPKMLSADQVREMLRRECEKAGGLRKWGRANLVSAAYVSRVLHGEKEVGDSIAKALGVTRYVAWTIDKRRKRA
jgi:hypothetical protein